MIRYSSYHTNPNAPIQSLGSIAKEYRELQQLREQVRQAEAAAAERPESRVKLAECTRPAAKVVSRNYVHVASRQSREFTKRQLHAMLSEAVRNTASQFGLMTRLNPLRHCDARRRVSVFFGVGLQNIVDSVVRSYGAEVSEPAQEKLFNYIRLLASTGVTDNNSRRSAGLI